MSGKDNAPTVPLPPICVSQLTSEAVLGIPSRRFRELVARSGIQHARAGKLVVVEVTTFTRWLRESSVAVTANDDATDTAEAMRRRLGLKVTAGGQGGG